MIIVRKLGFVIIFVLLGACSSEPTNKSYVGTGKFDEIEAAKTRVSLGLTYLKNGNFSQAKFNLDKALEFAPRSGEANFAMAFYYQQVEEFARAEEYYQRALGYSRRDPDVLNSYGAFLCEQGKYDQAKEYFLQAVDDKSYISAAETYENLAICSQSQGYDAQAIEYLNSALNHQPTRASSLLSLSELYAKQEDWEAAKKTLWKYERNANVSPETLFLSYKIAQGQGDLKASLEYVELLKSLYPSHANTQTAISELGKFKPQSTIKHKKVANILPNEPEPEATTEVQMPTDSNVDAQSSVAKNTVDSSENVAQLIPENAVDEPSSQTTISQSSISQVVEDRDESKVPDGFHLVLPKENLYRISLRYNVKIEKLLLWNNLDNASSIQKGSILRVKAPQTNE